MNEPQFKPQTYEEWKAAHGFKPAEPPRLEIGQRVKAAHPLSEDDEWLVEWDDDERPPDTVDEGTLGTITKLHETQDWMYCVHFDNGVIFYCAWTKRSELEDGWEGGAEIKPVGKSPSELAHEASERERLAAYRQLTLFGEGEVR